MQNMNTTTDQDCYAKQANEPQRTSDCCGVSPASCNLGPDLRVSRPLTLRNRIRFWLRSFLGIVDQEIVVDARIRALARAQDRDRSFFNERTIGEMGRLDDVQKRTYSHDERLTKSEQNWAKMLIACGRDDDALSTRINDHDEKLETLLEASGSRVAQLNQTRMKVDEVASVHGQRLDMHVDRIQNLTAQVEALREALGLEFFTPVVEPPKLKAQPFRRR